MRPLTTLLSALALVSAAPAHAEADWFASLYTGEGTELRADERVFTLFAVLNAMGYDAAPLARQHPIPRYQFHPVRQQVRHRLLTGDPEVRKQAEAFFDAHPQPIGRYLAYALSSDPPPFQSGPKAKEYADLKGLEALLRSAHGGWKLEELLAQVQGEYRKALKGYLTAVDGPMARARKLLRLPDEGRQSLLVVNLLEAQNEVRGVVSDSEIVLVVGPSEKPNVDGVVREFARVVLEPSLRKVGSSWGGGAAMMREAQAMGATEQNVADYTTALFSRALALKAQEAPDAAYEAAAQKGYFGLKEIAKGFEEAKPVDAWALEALGRAETRRPAPKK